METDPTTVLMEIVLQKIDGMYLSDLHDRSRAADVRQAVLDIPEDRYAADAWLALADYIMRENRTCETKRARDALLAFLAAREGV